MTDPVNPTPILPWSGPDPDPSDPSTYGVRGRARWSWEAVSLVPGANTVAAQAYTNALAALEAAELALANANYRGAWSSLTGPLSKPATVSHAGSRWSLLNDLADVTASTPGVSADWELYQPITAAGVSFDPSGTQLVATQTQAAIAELALIAAETGLRAAAGRNLVRNRNMLEVNRRRAWSYPQALSAGVFVQDAWRAGTGGCTVVAQGMRIEISAGTVVQTVFTSRAYAYETLFPPNTPITIAWEGTSQARVDGSAYSASPLTFSPANVPQSFELEFNAGTVQKVRAHIGTVCPDWEPQSDIEAQAEADFDYQELFINHRWDPAAVNGQLALAWPIPSRMRAGTAATWGTPTVNTNISGTPILALTNGRRAVIVTTIGAAAGPAHYQNTVRLSSGV